MIKKTKKGYKVVSKKSGRNLGGPYKSRKAAVHRLQQVEYFKHGGTARHGSASVRNWG